MSSKNWTNAKLEEISLKISDGIHTTPQYVEHSEFFFINGNNLKNNAIVINENTKCVSEEEYNKHKKELAENTILLSINGTIGSLAYYNNEKVVLGKSVAYINLTENVLKQFVYYCLHTPEVLSYYESELTGSTIRNLSLKSIKNTPIFLPPLYEQACIADLLSSWDSVIEKAERLIVTKEKQYLWLLSNLISNDKNHRGHIRDFASEVSTRNNGTTIDLVLSVTNNRGFVLPADQFERRVASSDLSNYKIVTGGQYAYNPSRINVGSIARLDGWDKGVLSPMYVVFEVDEEKINSDFFLHWLESHEAKERIRKSAQGSVRETVSFTDFGAIPFPLPPLNKQIALASILNTARQEIDLLKKQLEAYRKQKRGLMQKLLTGQWRVKVGLSKGEKNE